LEKLLVEPTGWREDAPALFAITRDLTGPSGRPYSRYRLAPYLGCSLGIATQAERGFSQTRELVIPEVERGLWRWCSCFC
uniref:Uncharacterized protein n=1 Tax=Wuchereria bancrofti TaxID=6293 RepID=A0AAF5PIU2_WUCBA